MSPEAHVLGSLMEAGHFDPLLTAGLIKKHFDHVLSSASAAIVSLFQS